MKTPKTFRTLLVFPPVWTPVTPYLALPLLTAYLRNEGLSVTQCDAGLDFFDHYLLTPGTLSALLAVVLERSAAGHYDALAGRRKKRIEAIRKDAPGWKDRIAGVRKCVQAIRNPSSFYDPAACMRAQQDLYALLGLASLAFHPTSFTFNTFANPDLTHFRAMASFCDDRGANPFLGFYSLALPGWMEAARPSLVGISISTSHQLAGALSLGRTLKRTYPSVHVTLGGKHCRRLMEAFFENPEEFPLFCDSMILDNGERPLRHLILRLSEGSSLDDVPHLIRSEDGRLVSHPAEPHVPIGDLPAPDFTDLPLARYYSPEPILPVRLSEGCYWGKCSFCSRYDNRRFRTVPPGLAADQLEALQRRHPGACFTVNDDCLTPTYLEALCRMLLKRGLRLRISLWCKPVHSFTRERLALMAEAGVKLIRWGVETGHPRILKLMNKGTRLESTVRVLRDASDVGIWNHATIILGFPGETEQEARTTLRFLKDHRDIIHSSIFFRFVLLKNAYIARHPDAFHIEDIRAPKGAFSYELEFSCAEGMRPGQLSRFLAWAQKYRIEKIYRRPFWVHLRIREYLLLYAARFGQQEVRQWSVNRRDLSIRPADGELAYFFAKPGDIPPDVLDAIRALVASGGEVGGSWIQGNLEAAFRIAYAAHNGKVVGVMTHKVPLPEYVREIEKKTRLDLQGYLERGYSYVLPKYRGKRVGDRMLKGLVKRSPGRKIYVTIRMDNEPAVRLTRRNRMRLAATFCNERTGHDIGVFVNG